jgi:hypothetical protein
MDEAQWSAVLASLPPAARSRMIANLVANGQAPEPARATETARTAGPSPVRSVAELLAKSAGDAFTLPGRALYGEIGRADEMDQGQAVGEAMNFAGMVSTPAIRGARAPNTVSMSGASDSPGIRGYHGSPHDFDRFSLDKIGTGEGNQAYGHGLYFAEKEDVAKGYRNNLGFGSGDSPMDTAKRILLGTDGNQEAALQASREALNRAYASGDMAAVERARDAHNIINTQPEKALGRMYEVNIKASPDDFLDWDKPIYEQSASVKERLLNAGIDPEDYPRWTVKPTAKGDRWTVYNVWGEPSGTFKSEAAAMAKATEGTANHNKLGGAATYLRAGGGGGRSGAEAASTKLREAGILGIRYLDQGSRGVGEGSRNIVAFDDSIIEILRKYGLIGPLGLGAGAAATGTNDGS